MELYNYMGLGYIMLYILVSFKNVIYIKKKFKLLFLGYSNIILFSMVVD